MNIEKDKLLHLAFGTAAAVGALAVVTVAQRFGFGPAAALASTIVGLSYELLQKVRKSGEPDPMDAVFTAAPGWLVWAVLALTELA